MFPYLQQIHFHSDGSEKPTLDDAIHHGYYCHSLALLPSMCSRKTERDGEENTGHPRCVEDNLRSLNDLVDLGTQFTF